MLDISQDLIDSWKPGLIPPEIVPNTISVDDFDHSEPEDYAADLEKGSCVAERLRMKASRPSVKPRSLFLCL